MIAPQSLMPGCCFLQISSPTTISPVSAVLETTKSDRLSITGSNLEADLLGAVM